MRDGALVIAGAAIAALVLWGRRAAGAANNPTGEVTYLPPRETWYPSPEPSAGITFADQVSALLWAIRLSEHSRADVESGRDYYTLTGGGTFSDTSDHPAETGEFAGIPVGGGLRSYAAGAYQITRDTWRQFREAGSWGPRLEDFGPESQDTVTLRILKTDGALDALAAGDFDRTIAIAGRRWASLPGSPLPGRKRSFDELVGFYTEGLPEVA